jgi:hypothetical protein
MRGREPGDPGRIPAARLGRGPGRWRAAALLAAALAAGHAAAA